MSDSDSDDDCGIIRPSLIKQLKSILDQYPDDGQILKELIQNAEDAGASEVTFLYDQHSHGTQKLYHDSLDIHQGPGLLAYNNASFTKEDWTGIRSLYESIKEEDPLKVGRFGLGFKSVFHLTDLPSILSGQQLLMLDPHENILNKKGRPTSGQMWNLKKDKTCLMEIKDQFTPYLGLFECCMESLEEGGFKGTLFRFPFRKQRSRLSKTVYHDRKIKTLFKSFKADAHLVLLFLKRVERVVLSERRASDRAPQKKFEVRIAETCRETVQREREDFLQRVVSSKQSSHQSHISSSYKISIEVLQNEDVTNTYHYLIRECYAAGEVSTTFRNLRQELEKSYVPMVGIAMQLTDVEAETRSQSPEGQTFCVLPLPREQNSSSGLPVHINGYFSVEQNRRHLKWKTTGQHEDCGKDVAWNTCLLSEVLPACYADLIKTAIGYQKEHGGVSIDDIYTAVPNLSLVDEKWQVLVREMFGLLLQEKIFFTLARGGEWVLLEKSIFDISIKDKSTEVVRDVLLSTGQNIVTPPTHIETAVNHYTQDQTVKVSPQLIRRVLQQNPESYTHFESEKKMALLEVTLEHLTQESVKELFGISLIPLANHTFAAFQDPSSSGRVYIPSRRQETVLQRMKHQLLDINIAPHLLACLQDVAKCERTCLKKVTPTDMPKLIGAVLPQEWQGLREVTYRDQQGPSAQWFEQLWKYLVDTSLDAFEGLMIMPLTTALPMQVIALDKESNVILTHCDGTKLDVKLQDFLKNIGVFVVERVPEHVWQHSGVLRKYIKPPTAENVMKAILSASDQSGCYKLTQLLASDYRVADEVAIFLSRELEAETHIPSAKERDLLKQLPLFITTRSTSESPDYSSTCQVSKSIAYNEMLQFLPCRLLLEPTGTARSLCRFLGVELISTPSFCKDYIIPCIEGEGMPSIQIRELMIRVSELLPSIAREDKSIYDAFSGVAFVETSSGMLKEPRQLFHPHDSRSQTLFSSLDDMFPVGVYSKPDMLAMLDKMMLRREHDIGGNEVEKSLLSLKFTPPEKQNSISVSILEVLGDNPSLLTSRTDAGTAVIDLLQNHFWVPVRQNRPVFYPQSLKWLGSICTCKPTDVIAPKWANLVGSVKAVVSEPAPELERVFAWQEPPSLQLVVQHLENIIGSYRPEEKVAYLSITLEMYRYFQNCKQDELQNALKCCPRWLWVGDQFARAECVVLDKPFMNLEPFVHSLPQELRSLNTLWLSGLGVKPRVDTPMLVDVLHEIKELDEELRAEVELQTVVAILNHIRKTFADMDDNLKSRILVPTDSSSGQTFELQLVAECSYCDREWLRKGLDADHFSSDEEHITLVHREFPVDTARDLGVTPLIKRVMHSEQLEITAFGQSESLTNRIRRLLEDYTDGLAVFKEMIQNADDAGATEVKFLYDERTNDGAQVRLVDPKLKECQGPALWIYNDAVFKNEDFKNIISLGNSSKEEAVDKVGKFGLGFNVVYNLTDVPSFVTGESIVVFDPQLNHLSTVVNDQSNPGIKLNIQRNKLLLKNCSDQFLPYQDVYGCDLLEDPDQYQGTLFRFPLRTAKQAARSKLCSNHYDRKEMIKLLKMFEQNAHSLLLFTQNVRKLDLDYLPKGKDPDQPLPIFTVQKTVVNIVQELSSSKGTVNLSSGIFGMLSFVVANVEALDDRSRWSALFQTTKTVFPRSKELLFTKQNLLSKRVTFCKPEHLSWIMSTVLQKQASSMCGSQGFQIGGVALQLKAVQSGFLPQSLENRTGQVFCGLPLPVYCDLPVHINGNFALHSSRRGFPQGTGDDKHKEKLEWNETLMKDVLSDAYLCALEDTVKILPRDALVEFNDLWPVLKTSKKKDHVDVTPLLDSFFSNLLVRASSPLLHDEHGLVTMGEAVFIDTLLAPNKDTKAAVLGTMVKVCPTIKPIILPLSALHPLRTSAQGDIAQGKWFDFDRYFREIVFPNLETIPGAMRETLIPFALQYQQMYDSLLSKLSTSECMGILSSLKGCYGEKSLERSFLKLACGILRHLAGITAKGQPKSVNFEQALFIPNGMNVLTPLGKLYYTDADEHRTNSEVVSSEVPGATARALGVNTYREYLYNKSSIGIPFGQSEDLSNAIRRVLQTYPPNQEILKELIQNADDAKATQIHFIFDQRTHPSDRVFSESWKLLQGPALCVFSDSTFTEEDLKGIQQFGVGSKGEDPNRIGQYGIGFNSVYHLTDAPSVLTTGPDLPKTLCVFDPLLMFVPEADPFSPGRRFVDLEPLRKEFPDVFCCYFDNEEHFTAVNRTMFRLPLRNPASYMSSISQRSPPDIQTLFTGFEKEVKECLLFLSNINTIEMSVVSETGIRRSIHKVEARLDPHEQQRKRVAFAKKTRETADKLSKESWNIGDIPLSSSVKWLELTGSQGYREKWLVAESLGVESGVSIPQSVQEAVESGELRLLPRGGVAAPISPSIGRYGFKGRAFCFLPMPLETNLPFHVNGHFALGHENRRHLWTNSDTDGYKKKWNDFLCENVISVAYAELLVALRKIVGIKSSNERTLKAQLTRYQSYFPVYIDEKESWYLLVKACYRRLASLDVCIFPVLVPNDLDEETKGTKLTFLEIATVTWKSLRERGTSKVFFPEQNATRRNLGGDEKLQKCLLRCRFALVEFSETLTCTLEKFSFPITRISPREVLTGFQTRPLCKDGILPTNIAKTPIQNEETLFALLHFCEKDEHFLEKLEGLPFLLTADDQLRIFNKVNPAYVTERRFQDLFPASAHLFLKYSVYQDVFARYTSCTVFKQFDMEAMSHILEMELPKSKLCGGCDVVTDEVLASLKNGNWLKLFWEFVAKKLADLIDYSVKPKREPGKMEQHQRFENCRQKCKQRLRCIEDWCLIPTTRPEGSYLVSVGNSQMVLGHAISQPDDQSIYRIVSQCWAYKLDTSKLEDQASCVLQLLATTTEHPGACLDLLYAALERRSFVIHDLKEASALLTFFCRNIDILKKDANAAKKLADLPIHKTLNGALSGLSGYQVFVLPENIPQSGIEISCEKTGALFIEYDKTLKPLYRFVNVPYKSLTFVYCNFIFPHFEMFSEQERCVHLGYLYQCSQSTPQNTELLDRMKKVALISASDGSLHRASFFYDQQNPVFAAFKSEFAPPGPPGHRPVFSYTDWRKFLLQLGLVETVSREIFLECVEAISAQSPSVKTQLKLKVVLNYIRTRKKNPLACLDLLHLTLGRLRSVILNEKEASSWLTFFHHNLNALKQDASAAKKLADLPIHKTIKGNLTGLSDYHAFVLPKGLPQTGIEVSCEKTGVLFLEYNESLKPLYLFLSVQYKSLTFFYCDFIFPHFEMFSEEERCVHFWYLYQCFQSTSGNTELLDRMKQVALLSASDGSLQRADHFYDQQNPVLAAFKSEFAPPRCRTPFSYTNWRAFLLQLGLVETLSPALFLECARDIAAKSPSLPTMHKPKVLMDYIFNQRRRSRGSIASPSDQVLHDISEIAFVQPAIPSIELRTMCPPLKAHHNYIKLRGAIPEQYEELVWTQVRLLPTWADPGVHCLNELREQLGIQTRPPIKLVLQHLCTIAEHLSSSVMDLQRSARNMRIFKHIYEYIQRSGETEDGSSQTNTQDTFAVQDTKCILVEKGTGLVSPRQIVRDLPQQIEPFLYRIPDEMMAFQELFMQFGATNKPAVAHYVMVLNQLFVQTRMASKMNPNQIRQAFLAVKGLFNVLINGDNEFPDRDLYFPSVCGTMRLSKELVYNDVPSFFNRIKDIGGKELVNLAECGIEPSLAVVAVEKLPKEHQPRFVSNEIEEILDESVQVLEESHVACHLNQRIRSELFRKAAMQLLIHEECLHSRQPKSAELVEAVNKLEMVRVHAVDQVHTILKNKKTRRIIKDSSAEKVCHVTKSKMRDFDNWDLYIKGCSNPSEKLLIHLAKVINQILDGRLHASTVNLLPLFTCSEDKLVVELKELDVNVGALEMTQQEPLLPKPGREVSPTDRNMMKREVPSVRVDDFVAIMLDGREVPIYAQVKAISGEDNKTVLLNIGQWEPERVSADRVFTF